MKWAKSGIYGYLQIGSGDNSSLLHLLYNFSYQIPQIKINQKLRKIGQLPE